METAAASPAAAAQPAPKITEPTPAVLKITEPTSAAPKITEPRPAAPKITEPTPTVLKITEPTSVAPLVVVASLATVAAAGRGEGKRKRGRPRKYGPDGGLLRPLKATPISASVPDDAGVGHYTPAAAVGAVMRRGSDRPVGFVSRAAPVTAAVVSSPPPSSAAQTQHQQQLGLPLGDLVGCASGANFTPHILNVAAGEDVNMKVISFSQQGPRAICVLSANGVISNVTLRQHDSLGGTVTYEGRFELLSLSGSFTPTDSGGSRDRSGGMSVSLAAADGRVIGGGVAGLLVAASPVQVVVGSFLPGYQMDQNARKPVVEMKTVAALPPPPPTVGFTISSGGADMEDSYSGISHPPTSSKGNPTPAFRVENWTAPADDAPPPPPPPSSSSTGVK